MEKRSHSTGNVRIRDNAYGHRKVTRINFRAKSKTKPHSIQSAATPTSKRKGLTTTGGAYDKTRYVGRKTGRKA